MLRHVALCPDVVEAARIALCRIVGQRVVVVRGRRIGVHRASPARRRNGAGKQLPVTLDQTVGRHEEFGSRTGLILPRNEWPHVHSVNRRDSDLGTHRIKRIHPRQRAECGVVIGNVHQTVKRRSPDTLWEKTARDKRVGADASFKKGVLAPTERVVARTSLAAHASDSFDWIKVRARPEGLYVSAVITGEHHERVIPHPLGLVHRGEIG
mmetsp:Transcript_8442/g.21583  ORF Transcript_8442/g.21583 Transcript_8442/m.21583 type:complete len:210 (-) Transcript_8442:779-1408(-)